MTPAPASEMIMTFQSSPFPHPFSGPLESPLPPSLPGSSESFVAQVHSGCSDRGAPVAPAAFPPHFSLRKGGLSERRGLVSIGIGRRGARPLRKAAEGRGLGTVLARSLLQVLHVRPLLLLGVGEAAVLQVVGLIQVVWQRLDLHAHAGGIRQLP